MSRLDGRARERKVCTVWSVLGTGNETRGRGLSICNPQLPRGIASNALHIPFPLLWAPLHLQLGCPGAVAPAPCERVFLRSGSGSQSRRWGGGHRDMVTLGAARRQCTERQGQAHLKTNQDVFPLSHSDSYSTVFLWPSSSMLLTTTG